jgi:hypothetical protein
MASALPDRNSRRAPSQQNPYRYQVLAPDPRRASRMVLAVPGLCGLFSLLQEALWHETRQRIRLTPHMHDFLDNVR